MVTIRVFILLCSIATIQAYYRNLCAGDNCDASCDGDDCNYCSGSTCCETSSCNQCVNRCSNSCQSSGCYNDCFQGCAAPQCASCNSCTTRSCSRRCQTNRCDQTPSIVIIKGEGSGGGSDARDSSYKHDGNLDSKIDNKVDAITNVTLENNIENINNISIPIRLNSTNINTITVKQPPGPAPKDVEVITIKKKKEKSRKENNCCVVIPPRQCQYQNQDLQCQQTPYRTCSSVCNSPVVVPHPVPVPVYIPKPYPVPQPYPVVRTVEKPVPVPHPIHVPVIQHVEKPVPVPHPVHIPVIQRVPQPIGVPVPVRQEACPMTYYGNNHIPVCYNAQQAQQFIGSSQAFLMDTQYSSQGIRPQCMLINQYPWLNCNNIYVEGCAPCLHCQGAYNPGICMQSASCSNSCRQVLQQVQFPSTIGQTCRVLNRQFTCV